MIACTALLLSACRGDRAAPLRIPGDPGSAGEPHITVEVLNAGGRAGSAHVATRMLRHAGIDVVNFGNANSATGKLDSTRIIVRRGSRDAALPVRAALGVGKIAMQFDSTRLLDVSVFLGADFTPRLEFHP